VKETILVIGGCRSGKSRQALELAEKISGSKRIFIATCMPLDDEMKERIERHKRERDKSWKTVEAPVELPEVINENSIQGLYRIDGRIYMLYLLHQLQEVLLLNRVFLLNALSGREEGQED